MTTSFVESKSPKLEEEEEEEAQEEKTHATFQSPSLIW